MDPVLRAELHKHRKIYANDPGFMDLPSQVRHHIQGFRIQQDDPFQSLQKEEWIRKAIPYMAQKYSEEKHRKKDWQWFLQLVAFLLFHDKSIMVDLFSNDTIARHAVLSITKDKTTGNIHLVITRDLPQGPPPVDLMNNVRTTTCELEFVQRSPYGAPYALLTILFILLQKYRGLLEYTGNDTVFEILLPRMRQWYFHGNDRERGFIEKFIHFPVDFDRVVQKTALKKYQRHFLNCVKTRLGMKPFRRRRAEPMTVQQFFRRYDEPD